MFGNKIKRDCDRHNQSEKNVRHTHTICADDFFSNSEGDLLITGGNVADRTEAVAHAIIEIMYNKSQPVIVFSNSHTLKEALINHATNGAIGRLFVCDNCYKNYDAFAGMSIESIANYFCKAAELYRFNIDQTAAYAYAFLNIILHTNDNSVNLKDMIAYANMSQSELAEMETSGSDYEMLCASVGGAAGFKYILANTVRALSDIRSYDCNTEFNITTAASLNTKRTIFIYTESINANIMRLYFINELSGLLNRHMTIVFDDCMLLNAPEFQSFVSKLKARNNINLIISASDSASIIHDEFTRSFRRYMILLGESGSMQLQMLLSSFGEYNHFEPGTSISSPPSLLPNAARGRSKSIITYSRAKVRIEEEIGNSVILYGHQGSEILISKYMTFKNTSGGNLWISKI